MSPSSQASAQKVLVFDFGAQYGQLIARRVRDLHVYSEIVPCDITAEEVREMSPSAIILSGGPASVNAEDAPRVDPAIYEQAALGIRTQAQAQAEAQGTTLSAMLADQEISLEQYERMTALQASDMVNQGLALDAWARHHGIEPSEEDVMEMIESMAPGHEKELLEELGQDPAQLEALSIAVMRFAANKHLAATAIVE